MRRAAAGRSSRHRPRHSKPPRRRTCVVEYLGSIGDRSRRARRRPAPPARSAAAALTPPRAARPTPRPRPPTSRRQTQCRTRCRTRPPHFAPLAPMDTDAAPPAERRHALHAWLPPPLAEAAAQTDLANWEAALKAFLQPRAGVFWPTPRKLRSGRRSDTGRSLHSSRPWGPVCFPPHARSCA